MTRRRELPAELETALVDTRSDLDRRATWKDWSDDQAAREETALIHAKAEALSTAVYPLELARQWATDFAHATPPDWRFIRPQLEFGKLLQQQPEWSLPDVKDLHKRLNLLYSVAGDPIRPALAAVLHGLELQAQAREAAAFAVGAAFGHEQEGCCRLKARGAGKRR